MKLEHEFIQLPYQFDVARMQQEVNQLASQLWIPHHEGFKGNYSIPLIAKDGQMNNEFKGPMACTPVLEQCPYLRQVIASFGEIIGRSRLMGLDPGSQVPVHSDINYHWYKRVRIHIPIITKPEVVFHCGEKHVHMQAGESWIFDSWKYHHVQNQSDLFRVHLVIDICGSADFWRMAKSGAVPWIESRKQVSAPRFVEYIPDASPDIQTERFNTPLVMSPGEMDGLAAELLNDVQSVTENKKIEIEEFVVKVTGFCQQWRCLWSLYGFTEAGWPHYHALRQRAFESVRHLDATLKLQNGTQAPRMFLHCMIDPGLNVEVKSSFITDGAAASLDSDNRAPAASLSQAAQKQSEPVKKASLSRNDPCHCGSGLKFKACHGKLT